MNYIQQILKIWCEAYKANRGLEYHPQEKDNKAIGLLLKKIKSKHPNKDSEQVLDMLSKYFKDVMLIQDNWLNKNMSLPILNSKINEINLHVKDIRQKRKRDAYHNMVEHEKRTNPDMEMLGSIFGDVEQLASNFSINKKEIKLKKPMTKSEFVKKYGWHRMNEWDNYKKENKGG